MFAQANERRVYELTLTIPSRGLWTADAKLDTGDAFTATSVTLTLAGLSMVGAVYRTGSYSGVTWLRLVGGAGGWHQTIEKDFYQNPFGLQLAPIATDAARLVGETVQVSTNPNIGTFYVRQRGPAVRVLNHLATSWYPLPSGVTFIGARTTPRITSRFDVLPEGTNLGQGSVTIATDFPEQWTPGCLFSSNTLSERQASIVTHRLTSDRLRTEVWCSP
jgi:hypothetical protein